MDNLLPLFEDNFYRERIWRMTDQPKSLEVDIQNQWHDLLLEGKGTFDVPAGDDYRLEAYHGFFWSRASNNSRCEPEESQDRGGEDQARSRPAGRRNGSAATSIST